MEWKWVLEGGILCLPNEVVWWFPNTVSNGPRNIQNNPSEATGLSPMPPHQIYPKTSPTLCHLSPNEPKLQYAPIRFLTIPRPKQVTFRVLKWSKWLTLDLGSEWQKLTLKSTMPLLHTSCFVINLTLLLCELLGLQIFN